MIDNENEKDTLPDETAEVNETAEENEAAEIIMEDSEFAKLTEQLSQEKDRYLRIAAEYDNFRKRSVQDRLNAASDACGKTVTEFLSVIDNFERALSSETVDENYKKGIEMIFNQFNDILKKLGIEEIEALNMPFDPNSHHAVNQVEDENFGENTVCQVFQKGYKLGGKIIRCAMVVVANP